MIELPSSNPEYMNPCLPSTQGKVLADLSNSILAHAGRLSRTVHPVALEEIKQTIHSMNSYYSNVIEGHRTTPRDIEKALEQNFSRSPKKKELQRLGLAHRETEEWLEQVVTENQELRITSKDFLCQIHYEFYKHLPETFLRTQDKKGQTYTIEPGKIRDYNVDIGSHNPPAPKDIDGYLKHFEKHYEPLESSVSRYIVSAAAAHHRFLWIHPFGDGNGRVARLFSHAYLMRIPHLMGHGVWTLSRGLARHKTQYFELLQYADQLRENDFDGRGNLSEKHLLNFVRFFLETMLDQIKFMDEVLDLPQLKKRIEAHLINSQTFGKNTHHAVKLIQHLLNEGQLLTTETPQITGLSINPSRALLKQMTEKRYIRHLGINKPYVIRFTADLSDVYFPRLFVSTL